MKQIEPRYNLCDRAAEMAAEARAEGREQDAIHMDGISQVSALLRGRLSSLGLPTGGL